MRLVVVLALVSFPQLVGAACVDVAAPGVPRYMRTAVAYSLAFEAGHNVVPTDGQGKQPGQSALDTICFEGVTDLSFLTNQTMLNRYTQDEQARQAAATVEAVQEAALTGELATSEACNGDLNVLEARFRDRFAAASTQAAKANVLIDGLVKVMRCVRALKGR